MRETTNVTRRRWRVWLWLAAVPVLAAVGLLAAKFSTPQTSITYVLMSAAALVYVFVLMLRRPRPTSPGPTSLIQQRMALDRRRTAATCGLGLLLIIGSSAVSSTVVRGQLDVFVVGIFVILLGAGWTECGLTYARYRRDLRAFEAAHGKYAGRQVPVRDLPGHGGRQDPAGDRSTGGS